ncbi:MAG: ATP-binding cassette domain-containing protein [Muribaculum sp.]|nr:ATP-binding cassette domain-containing protein [Muribaculum sp.]
MSHHYIKFDHVSYSYPNGLKALDDVSFLITHGEKVGLVGANGAGKSTLILHTNGLLMPQKGSVVIGDVPITKSTLPIIRRTVGLVFQNPDDQLFMPTVEEDVAFGPVNMKLPEEEVKRRVSESLKAVGAYDLMTRPVYELSGGQKRSVAIAGVLAMEPDVLVLDEPSSNLDPHARRLMIDRVAGFKHTCIIATHDMAMVKELCTRTIVLSRGHVLADGKTEDIFADRNLLDRAGLE